MQEDVLLLIVIVNVVILFTKYIINSIIKVLYLYVIRLIYFVIQVIGYCIGFKSDVMNIVILVLYFNHDVLITLK